MAFDYFFADRQADTGAFQCCVTVESFKDVEYLFGFFPVKADTVVLHNDPV